MPQIPPRRRLIATLGVAAATTLALVASTGAAPALAQGHAAVAKPHKKKPVKPNVKLQILAINDFHGQLEPSTSSSSGTINGTPRGRCGVPRHPPRQGPRAGEVQRPAQRDRRRG
ncbi:hypothetical protein [Nocardioides panacis]|uniref:hypothetical protein n=1 Tax=Nocardioides panacis TaxID=2849501 RepID=UPI0020B2E4E2|nr:hypothetical protein [Nocardioides panacis]